MGHIDRTAPVEPGAAVGHRQQQDQDVIFGKMVNALNQEASRVSKADRNPSRYDRVHVLLIRWEYDDLGVAPEVDALATVFNRDFGFEVSQLTIPIERSFNQLNRVILDWVDSTDEEGVLLIVYYAGHGQISDSGRNLIWSNRRYEDDEYYRELSWNGCEEILLQAAADKLFIFDCCYAANAGSTGGRGVSEVICASGFESIAPLPGPHSFTTALISVLQRMLQQTCPFSVSAIYSGVLSHLKALDPTQIAPDGYRIANALDYANAVPGLRRPEYRRTPVHFVRENRHHRHQHFGIQLFPLPRTQVSGFVVLHEESRVRRSKIAPANRVFTVKVRPDGDFSLADVDVTRRWLRSIPIPVQEIEVAVPSNPPPERKDPGPEKAGYIKVPPGVDLARATQSLERVERLNEELFEIAQATKRDSSHIRSQLSVVIFILVTLFPFNVVMGVFQSRLSDLCFPDLIPLVLGFAVLDHFGTPTVTLGGIAKSVYALVVYIIFYCSHWYLSFIMDPSHVFYEGGFKVLWKPSYRYDETFSPYEVFWYRGIEMLMQFCIQYVYYSVAYLFLF